MCIRYYGSIKGEQLTLSLVDASGKWERLREEEKLSNRPGKI